MSKDIQQTIKVIDDKNDIILLPTTFKKDGILKIIGINHNFELKISKGQHLAIQDYDKRYLKEIVIGPASLKSDPVNNVIYLCYINDESQWLGEWTHESVTLIDPTS